MGEELGNHKLRLFRRSGGVLPGRRALPEVDPTKPTKMVPFQTAANKGFSRVRQRTRLAGLGYPLPPYDPQVAVDHTCH